MGLREGADDGADDGLAVHPIYVDSSLPKSPPPIRNNLPSLKTLYLPPLSIPLPAESHMVNT